MGTTTTDKIPPHVINRIAAIAHVSPGAVRRALGGRRVLPVTLHAVRCACAVIGAPELVPADVRGVA